MGLFSKDKVSIPKINTLEVAREGGQAAEALAPTVSNLPQQVKVLSQHSEPLAGWLLRFRLSGRR